MKIAFFDTHQFDQSEFLQANQDFQHEIIFHSIRLMEQTANLAVGCDCACAFVNDRLNRKTLERLSAGGTRLIALRSAGFNHVDLVAAKDLKMTVVRVPEYSPHAVAEHAMALILTLNRKINRAYNRVREGNFSLDGLVGFDMHKKTVGVVGTGRIGAVMAEILLGFGCTVLAHDQVINEALVEKTIRYVPLEELLKQSDIITLHVPLNSCTKYLIDEKALAMTKPGVVLINTSRGALIKTKALIQYLKNKHIGFAGLDVYEEEEGLFFENLSEEILEDDQLARLLTFPNVIITSHQAFLTHEALSNIARTTLQNVADFESGIPLKNALTTDIPVPRAPV